MASFVFNKIKNLVSQGNVDFVNSTLLISLMDEDYFNHIDAALTKWSEISQYEIDPSTNPGYTSNVSLENINIKSETITGSTETNTIVYADDIFYDNVSTITAHGAVIYMNDTNKTLVLAIDFGGNVSSTNGLFSIKIKDNGFLKIK